MHSSKEIIEKTNTYGAHNYAPKPVVIVKAEGAIVTDPEGKEYFDKKYCVISKAHENNKLINVNGYQHVFEKYTYINLSYVSKFVNIQKENNKMEKDEEKERQISFSESSKDKKVDMHKNKSTSLIKLSKKNYNINNNKKKKEQEEGKNNKLKIFRNNSNINHQFKENYSSYDNKENLYNQNNNLRRFYDLGIEKNKNKLNKDKNNSCRLFISKEKDWDKIDEFVIETWG